MQFSAVILILIILLAACAGATSQPVSPPTPTVHPLLTWINDFRFHAHSYQDLVTLTNEIEQLTLQATQDSVTVEPKEWQSEMLAKSASMNEIIKDLHRKEDRYANIDGVPEFAFSERSSDCLFVVEIVAIQSKIFAETVDPAHGNALVNQRVPDAMECLEGVATELNEILIRLESEEAAILGREPSSSHLLTLPERTPVPTQIAEAQPILVATPEGTKWTEGVFLNGEVHLLYLEAWEVIQDEPKYVTFTLNEPDVVIIIGLLRLEYPAVVAEFVSDNIEVQQKAIERFKQESYSNLESRGMQNASVRYVGSRKIGNNTVATFDMIYDWPGANGKKIAVHELHFSFACDEIHSCDVTYAKHSEHRQQISDYDQQIIDYFILHITGL